MTRVRFLTDGGRLHGFDVSGHSTANCDDEAGRLVCAAVSSAVLMAANTITEVIGDKAEIEEGEGKLYFSVAAPGDKTVAVLEGLRIHISELASQYGNNIKVYSEV